MKKSGNHKLVILVKSVLISYLCTAILLFIIALLVYKAGIGATAISVLIVLTYIISAFMGGFITGKRVNDKRYLWGLSSSAIYLGIYLVLCLVTGFDDLASGAQYIKTALLVLFSGTLGGMLS